jgi:hypothetical protein
MGSVGLGHFGVKLGSFQCVEDEDEAVYLSLSIFEADTHRRLEYALHCPIFAPPAMATRCAGGRFSAPFATPGTYALNMP